MIKRINYTGRLKILRDDAKVYVRASSDGPPVFRTSLNLDEYSFPSDAVIRIEAQRQTTWMGFNLGTIAAPDVLGDHELSEFSDADGIQFRLRVVSAEAPRHIVLGAADGLSGISEGDDSDGREPLLPVRSDDIGMEVWRLSEQGRPQLILNKGIKNWRSAAKHPAFVAMVYPAIMRRLLALAIDDETETDDPKNELARWMRFAESIPGVSPWGEWTGSPDEWVEEAVGQFCRHQKMLERFVGFWGEVPS
jgi:hypothetical protein